MAGHCRWERVGLRLGVARMRHTSTGMGATEQLRKLRSFARGRDNVSHLQMAFLPGVAADVIWREMSSARIDMKANPEHP